MTVYTFNIICIIWALVGVATYVLLQFVTAPYGRHIQKGWGPEIANKLGWILMEVPSFLIILYFVLISNQSNYALFLSSLWLVHYFNRTFIYPFRIHTKNKKMPITIVLSAVFFNFINAGINGYYLANFEHYSNSAFTSPSFIIGMLVFLGGFIINQKSDTILINLRSPTEQGYKIPFGFLFRYVSCPNHLGELIQWAGFAILAWNIPATCFFIWTAANLLPRANKHHIWYLNKFENYPKNRTAIFPSIFTK